LLLFADILTKIALAAPRLQDVQGLYTFGSPLGGIENFKSNAEIALPRPLSAIKLTVQFHSILKSIRGALCVGKVAAGAEILRTAEGLNAASAIGDDRLQRKARGYITPDSFTHGSSAQRVRWFQRGIEKGNINLCNTFSADRL
jgi:hypothetical protein